MRPSISYCIFNDYIDQPPPFDRALFTTNEPPAVMYSSGRNHPLQSTSQLEIDVLSDKRFVVNGKNPGDGLMRYKIEDGGFCHEADAEFSNDMASEKALMALNAMRLCKDGKKLYTSAF